MGGRHLRQETCGRKSRLHIEIGVDIAAQGRIQPVKTGLMRSVLYSHFSFHFHKCLLVDILCRRVKGITFN